MSGLRHKLILLAAAAALVACASAPVALAAGGCGGPADSALNQYCEQIPTAHGGQKPQVGYPQLGGVLPLAAVRRIERSAASAGRAHAGRAAALRALLRLPAPQHAPRPSLSQVGGSSLPLWLILVLATCALALLLAAANRWRKREPEQPPQGS